MSIQDNFVTSYMQSTRLGIVSETKVNKIQSLTSDANSLEEKIKQLHRQHDSEKETEDSILNRELRSHPQYILDISLWLPYLIRTGKIPFTVVQVGNDGGVNVDGNNMNKMETDSRGNDCEFDIRDEWEDSVRDNSRLSVLRTWVDGDPSTERKLQSFSLEDNRVTFGNAKR